MKFVVAAPTTVHTPMVALLPETLTTLITVACAKEVADPAAVGTAISLPSTNALVNPFAL